MSDKPIKYNLPNVKELKVFEKVEHYEEHQYGEKQNLSEAAKEIQDLLTQLKQNNPEFSEEKLIEQVIENNPNLKARLINALKQGGTEALKVFFPFVSIPVETIRGFLEAS